MAALSLWLVPETEACQRLGQLIEELAGRLGTPGFAPHVTLLGRVKGDELSVMTRCAELAARLGPVPLTFPGASQGEEFYRCVFLEAEPTPQLLGAHQKARRALGQGPDRYRPHLSLVYGRLPAGRREALVEEARQRLALPLRTGAAFLEAHATSGPPARWRRHASFPLRQR